MKTFLGASLRLRHLLTDGNDERQEGVFHGFLSAAYFGGTVIIASVSEISGRWPRIGALLLSLPLTSILAFGFSWQAHGDLKSMSAMARETLILVPLTLPFFIPLAFAEQWHLGFWTAIALGVVTSSALILGWIIFSQSIR